MQKFVFIDLEEDIDEAGNLHKDEKLIFPRYHQLDVVSKILNDVKEKKAGRKYLVQHSAGSGKTYSITWLAHRLSSLHDKDNNPIFSSLIVVTSSRLHAVRYKNAFEPYYDLTRLDSDNINPNQMYTLYDQIMDSMLINKDDIYLRFLLKRIDIEHQVM